MIGRLLKNKYSIIGLILIIGMVAFIYSNAHEKSVPDVDISTINEAVAPTCNYSAASPSENRMIKRYYGFNPNDYGEMYYYAPTDTMDATELLIVKLNNESDAATIEEAIKDRLETQKKAFDGYGTNQTEQLNASRLIVKGRYILFVVDDNATKAADAFEKCF